MAIKKTSSWKSFQVNDAYHRIDWMNANMLNGTPTVEVKVGSYVSQDEAVNPQNAFELRSFVLVIEKANISLKNCYIALASLPEFMEGEEI